MASSKNQTYEEILDHIMTLEIIDTHEHLPAFEHLRDPEADVLTEYLQHYVSSDLISAGLRKNEYYKVLDRTVPLLERWDMIEPFWMVAKNTGYGRSIAIAVKDLYGIDQLSHSTIEELNSRFQEAIKPGNFESVLKDRCKISIAVLDSALDCDRELFRSVYRLDRFVQPRNQQDIASIENDTGVRICSFDDWLEACERDLENALDRGAVAIKSALSYQRTLKFERVSKSRAEEGFFEIFRTRNYPDWETNVISVNKDFEDYMMHFILRLANRRNLVFQIHTGLLEGQGNRLSYSNPALLSDLFLEYPDVQFDIFHISYPFEQELSALAKMFPNVYVNMCWAHIVSPEACVRALVEFLDTVPYNKISAFGGDYKFVDGVYGHQKIARQNVSKALAAKVNEGVFDIDEAKVIAKMLFFDNPSRILGL
jgi:predicted TIM-barrel fold metal-dependent hydrolase